MILCDVDPGIIDILQPYTFAKSAESLFSTFTRYDSSCQHPDYYADRFIHFLSSQCFFDHPEGSIDAAEEAEDDAETGSEVINEHGIKIFDPMGQRERLVRLNKRQRFVPHLQKDASHHEMWYKKVPPPAVGLTRDPSVP